MPFIVSIASPLTRRGIPVTVTGRNTARSSTCARLAINSRCLHRVVPPQSGSPSARNGIDPSAVLAPPTWSVRSLLPAGHERPAEEITSSQLHHLLRLSALPLPGTPEEETSMIEVLQSQLHFVRDIQKVDTADVEPLRSIRDETAEGKRESTIGLDQLWEALSRETAFGRSRRPRRERTPADTSGEEDWEVLGTASRTAGSYFVVRSGKNSET